MRVVQTKPIFCYSPSVLSWGSQTWPNGLPEHPLQMHGLKCHLEPPFLSKAKLLSIIKIWNMAKNGQCDVVTCCCTFLLLSMSVSLNSHWGVFRVAAARALSACSIVLQSVRKWALLMSVERIWSSARMFSVWWISVAQCWVTCRTTPGSFQQYR